MQNKNNGTNPSVLLISVDALKPEFVFEQERWASICRISPNILWRTD